MERAEGRLLLPRSTRSADPELVEALLELAGRLLHAGKPIDVASALLEGVVSTYGFPRGVVLGTVENLLSPLVSHGVLAGSVGVGSSAAVERAHSQRVTQVVAGVVAAEEPWLTRLFAAGSDLLVLPLQAEQRPLGALVLQVPAVLRGRRGRRLLSDVERAVEHAGAALHRVQQLGQLQRLAATDDLTMIANRRSFLASLDREIGRSLRRAEPFSLVILDLDHFKQVNDLHGHQAGDDALRNVAVALTVACRDLDTPARYGGEEFVVILPDCDVDQCVPIAERFRDAVRAAPAAIPLTASAGVATFPAHARDGEELVAAADAALLLAKDGGRDRTVVATGRVDAPEGSDGRPTGRRSSTQRPDSSRSGVADGGGEPTR